MQVYLVQHGLAKSKEEDPERPLTEPGLETARRMALQAKRLGVVCPRILHSDKRRAIQTAEAFAEALGAPLLQRSDLTPRDDPEPLANELVESDESVLIVGHLPHLARLASRLCGGDIAFQNAGIVRLDRDEERGGFHLRWAIPPETVLS